MVTLTMVARRAEVSVATASKALSATPATRRRIAALTRAKVLAAAEELGWLPPAAGRYPRLVALLHPETVSSAFFTGVYTQVPHWLMRGLSHRGSNLIVVDAPQPAAFTALANRIAIDAAVLIPPYPDGLDAAVAADGLPAVVINGETASGLHYLAVNEEAGVRALITQLVELGHRRFVYLDQERLEHPCWVQRRGAIRRICQEGGLALHRCLSTDEVIAQVDAGITAVVASSSAPAMQAFLALVRAGKRIPEDVSLASCDDSEPLDEHILGITGIEIPLQDMVGEAIRLFGQPFTSRVGRLLPGRLRQRRSVGQARSLS